MTSVARKNRRKARGERVKLEYAVTRWQRPRLVRLDQTSAMLHLLMEMEDGQPHVASLAMLAELDDAG